MILLATHDLMLGLRSTRAQAPNQLGIISTDVYDFLGLLQQFVHVPIGSSFSDLEDSTGTILPYSSIAPQINKPFRW